MTGPILEALRNPAESKVFQNALVRAVLYPVGLLLVLTLVFLWQLDRVVKSTQQVEQSNQIITQASVVLKLMVDMETGLRGYLITDEAIFLDPYNQARTLIDGELGDLRSLTLHNDEQLERLNLIGDEIGDWRGFAAGTLAADRELVDVEAQLSGKAQMDSIRDHIAAFIQTEEAFRSTGIVDTRTTSQAVVVSVLVIGLIVGALLGVFLRQQLLRLARSYTEALTVARGQAEEILNQQEWLTGVLSSIGDAVIATDLPGKITYINPVTEMLTGWSSQEAVGKPLDEVYKLVDESRVEQSPTTPAGQGEETRRLLARSGRAYAIDEKVTAITSPRGIPIGSVVVFRDVTRRRRIEQERLQLLEAQTRYAARLKYSNEQLQQFAYVTSHDLQEPLRMVISYLQLLENRYGTAIDNDAREFIQYAVDGAARMKALITDLLIYARLDARARDIDRLVALDDLVKQVLDDLSVAAAESGATITCDPLPEVHADPTQMAQLFQNLISNALKFQRKGVLPQVHIGVEEQVDGWRFTVRDNGIGIAPEFQERIFRLFQRLNTREEYEGTGIGLAICKKIVEYHQGHISVESAAGQGATFSFTLPFKYDQTSPGQLVE